MRLRVQFGMRMLVAVLCACAILASATDALGQSYDLPPKPRDGRPVLDQADLLTQLEERRLVDKLVSYADTTSTQIVVVTVPDLGGAPISDYAVALGREWGVGQEGVDNGLVILVSRDDRKVFIATGYGLEGAVPDAIANRIIDRIITPNFRQGQFFAGLDGATDAILQAAKGEYTATASPRRDESPTHDIPLWLFILVVMAVWSFLGSFGGGGKDGGRRRKRGGNGFIFLGPGASSSSGGGGFSSGGGFSGGFGGGSFGGGGAGGSW